jgi:alkylation response protein AidB-like acyl-CoA dehydrogenase
MLVVSSASDALVAARAIGETVSPRSAEIEDNRTLPKDIVDELIWAGLLKLFVPARYGGAEVAPLDGFAVTEELAYHDGATGWCQMIAMTTGLLGGLLPREHAAAIYGPVDSATGGLAAPAGRARSQNGGLTVEGRWQWGSGIRHCTWIGGGCLIVGDDGRPVPLADGTATPFVFFDPAEVEVLDTWYVAGLKGTGSTDYQVAGVFVPEGRWAQVGRPPVEDGPLYRFSFFGLLAIGVASVALGLARRAIDELCAVATVKTPQGSNRPLAERAPVQADVAMAEAALRSSQAFVADAIGNQWETVTAGDEPGVEERRVLRLAATNAMAQSSRAVDLAYTAAGGLAVYEDSPLQRVLRDVHVATQHAITAPRTWELAGRLRLGLDTNIAQL